MDAKTLLIAVLAVSVIVLGYFYYEHSNTASSSTPLP